MSSVSSSAAVLLEEMKLLSEIQGNSGPSQAINSELWHACAGPLVSLSQPGSLVYYFPQGHSEQVTASTKKSANSHIPNYPSLPSQLICQVHKVTLHADKETDEIYARLTLQPVNSEQDVFPISDFGHARSRQPNEFFCKILTASDTSTHGGFSVPRRAAEKLFPQLDYAMQPPNQELIVRDLHDNMWTFRHIYRGQPKRHLLTTGWSSFVGAKRLKAGDSVLFIRDAKSQLLLGIRRAKRQQSAMPSSVLSTDSMHMGVLAAAAHAAANRTVFTVYYNPRACQSEFIIPLAKYHKAAYTQVSIGMRFGMMFETEESTKRRYMGTVVGISDYDPLRWPNSKWRNLQVEWDENGFGERPERVNVWEIETPESVFVFPNIAPSFKRQCIPGFAAPRVEEAWFADSNALLQYPDNGGLKVNPIFSGIESEQLLNMLLQSHTSNLNGQIECGPPPYSNTFRNITCSNIPSIFSSTRSVVGTSTSTILQQECVDRTANQQESQVPVMQNFPTQIKRNVSHENQHGPDRIVCASFATMKPSETNIETSTAEEKPSNKGQKKEQTTPESSDESITSRADVKITVEGNKSDELLVNSSDTSFRKPTSELRHQPPADQKVFNVVHTPKQNILSSKDQEVQINKQNSCQVPQQQFKLNINQELSTISNQSVHPDTEHLFSHYSGHQLSPAPLRVGGSCKMDPLHLSATENNPNTLGDAFTTLNQENFNALDVFQFSYGSDTLAPLYISTLANACFGSQELNSHQEQNATASVLSSMVHGSTFQEGTALQNISGIQDLSVENRNLKTVYSDVQIQACNGSIITDPCSTSSIFDSFNTLKDSNYDFLPDCLVSNVGSEQDLQSQITSTSLVDSQAFALRDCAVGASSSSIDANEYSPLNNGSWKPVCPQPLRTYTKVQKLGSVGRSIDITRFKNYEDLKSTIARMFGLEGQLENPNCSEWKLVYVDYENDVLLVGDDPWEEFVSCVRCIRILSANEVQEMIHEETQVMNSSTLNEINRSPSLNCVDEWDQQVP